MAERTDHSDPLDAYQRPDGASPMAKWLALVGFIAACLVVGGVGAVFTSSVIPTWYAGIEKPSWTPPDWLFGPVWTALYVAMAVAAWLVWIEGRVRGARRALALFAVQLLLNAMWSPLFFGLRSPLAGLIDIAALWVAIVATLGAFWRVKRAAGWLFGPYLLWVTFAAFLNAAIWRMNG